ncbi:ionotropic receptor 75a-like [Lycorma delicatula]|uniref:ionotropic receptor 75a-like n=1 Tax=Lycorma delicatula TaxID=130591 RepID=UPI003F519004
MKSKFKIFIILLQTSFFIVSIDSEIVGEYFNSKRLVAVTVFACSNNDYIKLFKQVMMYNIKVVSGSNYLNVNASFTDLMHFPYYKMGVYVDFSCDFGKQVLVQSSNSYMFNSSYVWVIKVNLTTDIKKEFECMNFGLDSDVIIAVDSDNNRFNLFDVYKVNSTWPLIITSAGFYNNMNGLSMTFNGSIIQRRRDFRGIQFTGTTVIIDMNIKNFTEDVLKKFLDHTIDPHLDAFSRCVYTYYTYLMKMFNFTLKLQGSPSFGYPKRKGPVLHDGMIGQLEAKEVDVGAAAGTMKIRTRMDVVHFTLLPVWMLRCSFIFRHPRTLATYKALVIPFSSTVWVFILCLTLAVGVILTLIKHLSPTNSADEDKTLTGNIIIAIGALYQQGLATSSNKVPERIVLFCTLIMGVIIVTFYNSMIVTSLLQPPPKNLRTPKQLLDSSFTLGIQDHSYIKNFFETSTDPIVREMFNKNLKKGTGYLKPMEGIYLVQKTQFAFYSEEPIVYRIIENTFSNEDTCSLQEIKLELPVKLQIPLRRNSPLMEYFNHGLLLMKETGIMDGMNKKWRSRKPHCQGNTVIPSVQLQSVLIAYMVFLSGIICSLTILCFEIILFKCKIKFREKNNTVRKKLKYRKKINHK